MTDKSITNIVWQAIIGELKMRKLILIGLVLFSMFCAGLPANCQTVEQAKKAQVQRALVTSDGVKIKAAVNKYSKMYGVEPALVHAIILTESGYNRTATSSGGCKGLMQLAPATFRARGVGSDIYSIDHNVHAGTKHIAGLLAAYKGDVPHALAAYNAGGGNIKRGKPLPRYGQAYVNKVMYNKRIVQQVAI